MTTHLLITIILTSYLFGWSLRTTLRLLSPEKGLRVKQLKVSCIQRTRHAHTFVIVSGIVAIFFLPTIWPIIAAAAVYGLIVNSRLARKEKDLISEILTRQDKNSIITLDLGRAYDNPEGATLKLWFMPGQTSWPLVEIETGISYLTLPIEHTLDQHLREHFLPRLAEAIHDERAESMFLGMKNDLLAHGITHPIDIQGWNHHPIISDFIERILNAEPQVTDQLQTDTKAA